MGRFMTNSEAISVFKKIDKIKNDENLVQEDRDKQTLDLQNDMVNKLGFLVYSNAKQYRKFPNYEDLVQEGFVGLIDAVRKFNYHKYPNFFVWAERRTKHRIKRAASRFDVVYSPDKKRVVYAEPSEIEEEEVENTPEQQFFAIEQKMRVESVLGEFSDRDSDIIKRMFGIGYGAPQTLREIGPIYGITHERIRQIKNKVINKLRKIEKLQEVC